MKDVSLDAVIDTIEFYRTNPQHFTEDNLIEDIKNLPPIKKIPVVVTYSWETAPSVYLFDTDEEAVEFLTRDFGNEVRIDTEENGYVLDEDMSVELDEDGVYATITHFTDSGDDITTWSIGQVYEPAEGRKE